MKQGQLLGVIQNSIAMISCLLTLLLLAVISNFVIANSSFDFLVCAAAEFRYYKTPA